MKEMGFMRTQTSWLAGLLALGMALAPSVAWGQAVSTGYDVPALSEPISPFPLYSSRPEKGGLYMSGEFIYYRMTNPIKDQVISVRGFNDFDGSVQAAINAIVPGLANSPIMPGRFFGSGDPALDAREVSGPRTYQPGWAMTAGWRFGEGSPIEALEFRWRHLQEAKYNATASLVAPNFRAGDNLENTFLFSPVTNFPNEFAGPVSKLGVTGPTASGSQAATGSVVTFTTFPSPQQQVSSTNSTATNFVGLNAVVSASSAGAIITPQAPFGIWNGATTETISFVQRYDDYDIVGRIPIFQSDDCRFYGLVGGKHAAMWERFKWRTIDVQQTAPSSQASATLSVTNVGSATAGNNTATATGPAFTLTTNVGNTIQAPAGGSTDQSDFANYSNVVSNQLWGPMVGIGSEYYLWYGFSTSLDLRAGLLLDVVKERAAYERGDLAVGNKRSRTEYTIVPEVDAIANINWYTPIEGVEVRFGYDLIAYFNTVASPRPVSFNYGTLDPPWNKGIFRFMDGFQVGVAIVF